MEISKCDICEIVLEEAHSFGPYGIYKNEAKKSLDYCEACFDKKCKELENED